jgi:hypothetical protein
MEGKPQERQFVIEGGVHPWSATRLRCSPDDLGTPRTEHARVYLAGIVTGATTVPRATSAWNFATCTTME